MLRLNHTSSLANIDFVQNMESFGNPQPEIVDAEFWNSFDGQSKIVLTLSLIQTVLVESKTMNGRVQ